jgi:hypothetical protein
VPNTNVTAGKTVLTGPNDNGSYLVQPGGTLNVTAGLGPDSVVVDNGGTVIFASAAKELGNIFVLDKGILVFGNLAFIAPAETETIKIDGTSTLGIAGMTTSEPAKEFLWGTNLTANTADPTAGSFNIAFADLLGGTPVGLNVGLIGGAPNSLPPWSFSQVGIPGSLSGLFTANTLVPTGALNTTPNPTLV